ncbi:MAG: hypothetical protein RLZZ505_646 [Verrucomicrobiota bacterium]|jgi:hypothetical protein
MSGKRQTNDHPHIGLAVFSAGAMALALAAGLTFLGLMGKVDALMESMFSLKGMASAPNSLSDFLLWGGSALLAFLLPAVILNVPGLWRRLVIWSLTFALTFAWGPVLLLAAHKPQIGVALVAVLWSGFCAMVYTTNHVLPVDKPHPKHHGAS